MMAYGNIIVVAIVLIIIIAPLDIAGQNNEQIIFRITNRMVSLNEIRNSSILLESYAPHSIASSISPVQTITTDPLITIRIESETDGVIIYHYSDMLHSTSSFTPRNSQYQVEIKNNGHVDNVLVNLTIIQTGPANTTLNIPENDIIIIVISLLLISCVPIVLLTTTIILFKRRHQ
jgi:hypothetical protein